MTIAGGCVLPPDLSVGDGDAGVNSPPAVLAVRSDQQELPEGSLVRFERMAGTLAVSLLDTDVEDTLFVRIYVDYTVANPTPARSTCSAPPNGTTMRTASCDLQALCQEEDVVSQEELLMQVQVFDRPILDVGTPAFKAMMPGGLTTNRVFRLLCEPATT